VVTGGCAWHVFSGWFWATRPHYEKAINPDSDTQVSHSYEMVLKCGQNADSFGQIIWPQHYDYVSLLFTEKLEHHFTNQH